MQYQWQWPGGRGPEVGWRWRPEKAGSGPKVVPASPALQLSDTDNTMVIMIICWVSNIKDGQVEARVDIGPGQISITKFHAFIILVK